MAEWGVVTAAVYTGGKGRVVLTLLPDELTKADAATLPHEARIALLTWLGATLSDEQDEEAQGDGYAFSSASRAHPDDVSDRAELDHRNRGDRPLGFRGSA